MDIFFLFVLTYETDTFLARLYKCTGRAIALLGVGIGLGGSSSCIFGVDKLLKIFTFKSVCDWQGAVSQASYSVL